MPVINGVYLKDFTALPSSVTDANIIPIAITGNQIAYRTTVGGIVTDARVTSKLLTGLSVTGGAIAATDTILQAFGKVQNQINSKVSSVGLTMPSAFNVANSPITSSGTLAVTAAGVASQYIRGDGALADFPTNGGGGSSVSYYLNGSVSQGTFVGNTYYEMNKTPVIGTGTDFTISANGYIAQFITDANDPGSLLIPAGNWNVEMYFSASSSGGTPSFYVEVYKYNGTTFTLLGTSSATPEGITNGTAIDIYYTSVGIPETVLTITDRLAIRVYVTNSGRTITLHTEDNHLSEIVTTFSNGLTALNGLTKQAQYFAVGTSGTDFAISSSVDTHTFNLPTASATNRGALSSADWTTFNNKAAALSGTINTIAYWNSATTIASLALATYPSLTELSYVKGVTSAIQTQLNAKQATITLTTTGTSGAATFIANTLNIPNYADGGVLSLSAIGAVPNANAATITGTVLNLQPASASFGGVVTTGTQTFAGDKTLTGTLYGIGLSMTGTVADIVQGTATSGKALRGTATTGWGLYASATTGVGVQGNSSGTGGSGVYGSSVNGYGGVFYNDSTTYPALEVNNNNESAGNIAVFRRVGTSVFIINSLGNISNGTYTYTLPSATGTLALVGGAGVGTVTSVAALTLGTSGTDLSSTVANGTTTPVITLQVPTASAANRGALSSADWSTFNGKQGTITLTTTGTSGAATFSANTLNIPNYGSALSGYLPLTGGTLTGALSGTSASFSGNIALGTTPASAAAGAVIRLPFDNAIRWRNSGNTGDIGLYVGTSNLFQFDSGINVAGAATFSVASGIYTAVNATSPNTSVYYKLTPTGGDSYLLGAGVNATNDFSIYNSTRSAAYLTITGGASGGNVGIGTTSPDSYSDPANNLVVGTTSGNNGITIAAATTGLSSIYFADGTTGNQAYRGYLEYGHTNDYLAFGTAASERMRITSGGDVIVKGSLADFTIGSSGAELFFGRNSANYITANGGGGAEIRIISNTLGVVLANGGTSWGSLSDENSKDIIEPIVNACDNLSQIRTIIGKYKTDDEDKRRLFLIAQDIEKVYPEAVFRIKNEEEEESLALNYQDLIPVLVKAIQELKAEIDLLKGIAPIVNNLE